MEAEVKRGRGRPIGSKDKVKRARRGKKVEEVVEVKEVPAEESKPAEQV